MYCMHICIYVCICIFVYIYVHFEQMCSEKCESSTSKRMILRRSSRNRYIYIYTHIVCIYINIYVYIHIYKCVYVYVCIYIYTFRADGLGKVRIFDF